MIIPYLNIGGLDTYISYIKSCKRREYSIKFLDKIGVDVKQYETGNYSKELNVELENILEYYIGFSHLKMIQLLIKNIILPKNIWK